MHVFLYESRFIYIIEVSNKTFIHSTHKIAYT